MEKESPRQFLPYQCIKGQIRAGHTLGACLSVEMGRRFEGHYSHIFWANIHWDHSHSPKSKRAQEWEEAGNSLSPFLKIDQRMDTTNRPGVDLGRSGQAKKDFRLTIHKSSQININNDNCTCACGTIQNIKYPFRLAGDHTSCGLPDYQLSCVNNRTILLLNSNKSYLVLSINYERLTIRLVDPGLEKINNHNNFNSCSPAAFPRYTTLMEGDVPKQYSYSINARVYYYFINAPVIFIGCRNPAQSPLYVKMDACSNNTTTLSHSYVLDGDGGSIGELENSCSITAVAWYSSSRTRRYRSTDEEIGDAVAWGFELFWFRFNCTTQHCISDNYCFIHTDHSGAFINCEYDRIPCDLLRWPPHLEFNHKYAQNVESPLLSDNPARSSSLEVCEN
nr:rust resistance kinase Lr10-like [Ipomoea batatas]